MKDEGSRQEGRISGRAIWPWILVGVIIVLGGAGFCVYFFVIKKKIFEKK